MITVLWKWDWELNPYAKGTAEPARRIERFETKAQATRWIKNMKMMSKKHPDEAQFVHLETIG